MNFKMKLIIEKILKLIKYKKYLVREKMVNLQMN